MLEAPAWDRGVCEGVRDVGGVEELALRSDVQQGREDRRCRADVCGDRRFDVKGAGMEGHGRYVQRSRAALSVFAVSR